MGRRCRPLGLPYAGEFLTSSGELVADTTVSAFGVADGGERIIAFVSPPPVVLLLEYSKGVPLVVQAAKLGVASRSMRSSHVVAESATLIALDRLVRDPAIAGQDQMLIHLLHRWRALLSLSVTGFDRSSA